MGQGSKFYLSLSDVNLDRMQCRDWADLYRDRDWWTRARFLDRVTGFLDRLPPTERDVIDLYFVRGKRQATIAAMLGISQQAVSHRLHAAYRRISFLLDHPEVSPEQLRADLTALFPHDTVVVDVLCSFADTSNQTETARRLRLPQQKVCWHLQSALRILRETQSVEALFYLSYFERLLSHRSILCEVRHGPPRRTRRHHRTRTAAYQDALSA